MISSSLSTFGRLAKHVDHRGFWLPLTCLPFNLLWTALLQGLCVDHLQRCYSCLCLCVVHSVSLPIVGLIALWNSEDFWGLQLWTFLAYNLLIFNIFFLLTPIKFIFSPFPSCSLSKVKSSSFTFLSLYLWSAISVMPYIMHSSLGLPPNPTCASPNPILKLLVFLGLRCYWRKFDHIYAHVYTNLEHYKSIVFNSTNIYRGLLYASHCYELLGCILKFM